MSDSQDEHVVDTPSRKTEPNPVSRQGDLPPACMGAAEHVACCWRCRTAIAAHIDNVVAQLVAAHTGGFES
jgi:hypothetical protein